MEPELKDKNEDSSTKYILDYYRKYSQNRELPKYFSGTSIAYLPEITDETENQPKNPDELVSSNRKLEKPDIPDELELSPAGSSNRKLEWDNLADIGYDNAKTLHKSSSLPILPQLCNKNDSGSASDNSNVKVIIYPYTSSSEEKSDKKVPTCVTNENGSSSSSSDGKVLSFKQTLDYLKTKIGLPDAHSTPHDSKSKVESSDKICDTPFVSKPEKPVKKLSDVEIQTSNHKKIINLCLTKPILLDCLSKTCSNQLTIGVQTSHIKSETTETTCDSFEFVDGIKSSQVASNDIEKSIYVLQRLLRSKKFDSSTKKKHVKKILQKIVESKYLEDSSTSSELFYPKTNPSKILQEQIKQSFINETSSSYQSHEDKVLRNKRTIESLSPKRKKTQLPSQDFKKGPFTLTNSSLEEKPKESQTVVGDGDHMINFADKERQYQLNWIDKEIDHLGKLKSLLQKPKNSLDGGKVTKTTSVYVVTGSDISRRNYVIETELGAIGSQPRNFRLNGENYAVLHPGEQKTEKRETSPVVTDIEVHSDSKTTNIKVKTFCSICKRTPCICNSLLPKNKDEKLSSSTSSSLKRDGKTVQAYCVTCHNTPCFCENKDTGSSKCSCRMSPCACNPIPVKGYITCPSLDEEDKEVCLYDLVSSDGSSSSSKSNQLDSLRKIFINCKCDKECECNCDFVNKLLKHFNKKDASPNLCPKDIQTSENNKINVRSENLHNINNVNVNIQTSLESETSYSPPVSEKRLQTDLRTETQTHNINSLNILINNKKSNKQTCTSDNETDRNKYTQDELYSLISKLEEALLPQKRSYNPPKGEKYTMCVPEDVKVVQCGTNKPLSVDQGTTYSPERVVEGIKSNYRELKTQTLIEKGTICIPEDVNVVQCGTNKPLSVDQGTTYCPEHIDAGTLPRSLKTQTSADKGSKYTMCVSDGVQCRSNKPLDVDEGTTYSPDHIDTGTPPGGTKSNLRALKTQTSLDKGTKYTMCVPEDVNVVQCGTKKPLSVDQGTTYSPAQTVVTEGSKSYHRALKTQTSLDKGTKYTMCVPEDVNVVQCSTNKPLSVDQGTNYSSEQTVEPIYTDGTKSNYRALRTQTSLDKATKYTMCVPEDVNVVQCGTNKPLSVDQGTNYSPEQTVEHIDTDGTNSKRRALKTQTSLDKATKYTNCASDVVQCGTNKPLTVDQGTTYSPKISDHGTSYEPPLLKDRAAEYKSLNEGTKKQDGIVNLKVSKDVKSVDMSFCLCDSKKDKKKKRHKNGGVCNCNRCLGSKDSSDNSTRGDSNKLCHCACKCGFVKQKHTCCRKKPAESITPNEDPSSGTPTTNTTDSTPLLVCSLCRKNATSDKVSVLRTNSEEYPICSECMEKRPILTSTCYVGPDLDNTHLASDQSTTITDNVEAKSYCTCPKRTKNFEYCPHCRNKLKRTLKSGNGIAYTLTLEDDVSERSKIRKTKKKSKLQEIKVKVPCPYNRKTVKNEENNHRKDECRMKRFESGEDSEKDNISTTEISTKSARQKIDKKDYTLQEYLKKNRPDFIDSADYRRQAVLNNRDERKQNKDDMKLKFLEENAINNRIKRQNKLFSEQEMKEITRRNYKKLPEVQQKMNIIRLQKLRSADRFITDMFKRKIQNCILKGKSSFPLDTNIVNYYK